MVTLACVVLGVGSAFLVTRTDVPARRTFGVLAALVLTLCSYPYVYLPLAVGAVATAAAQAPPQLEQVARSLGRRPLAVFRTGTLPLTAPGVGAGLALAFLTCMKELPATLLLRCARSCAGTCGTRCAPTVPPRCWSPRSERGTVHSRPNCGDAGTVLRQDYFGHDAVVTLQLDDGTPVAARVFDLEIHRVTAGLLGTPSAWAWWAVGSMTAPGSGEVSTKGTGVLEVVGLRKAYGEAVAVDGLSVAVEPGEMFGFVGANGAGKTTTMRIVMGVLAADAGEVRWRGRPLGFEDRRRFGYLPEERGLYAKMRAAEQITYFGRLHGLSEQHARRAAHGWLERLGLTDRRGDPVDALSLGNQQRVQLAVALVHEPELLVLDEPFSGLDPLAVDVLAEVLAEQRAAGVPVIFSSHQLELVERLCDSVGIISCGRMVASGRVAEVREREARPALRVAVADAPAGWETALPATVLQRVSAAEVLVSAEDDQAVLRAAADAGRVVQFGVEHPSLSDIFRETVA